MKKSRQVVERIIENKETIYGITTGFGLFSDVLIDPSQYNELVNHSFPCMWYWETIFRRSGISNDGTTFKYIIERPLWSNLELVDQLKFFINERIIPVIPQQGSLGLPIWRHYPI